MNRHTTHTAIGWRGRTRTPFASLRDLPGWIMLLQGALLLAALAWGAIVAPGAGQ